jgi:hypothetical protein
MKSMRFYTRLIWILLIFLLHTSFGFERFDFRHAMNNNVCKEFKNDVLIYFVFVDSKETCPWTEFDIQSTLDSMNVAINWLRQQALNRHVSLNITMQYYIGAEYTTIRKNLPSGSVEATVEEPGLKKGIGEINKWADGIAAKVGKDVPLSAKDGIPEIKNPNNKERLIAHLRDEYKIESVALIYMVNNYFRNDISLTVNQFDTKDVEFSIVSYKYPSTIAQNILTLFGAADLFKTEYRRNDKNIKLAAQYFPNDIMQDVYGKNINKLELGPLTEYLIGWSEQLDQKYHELLTDKVAFF